MYYRLTQPPKNKKALSNTLAARDAELGRLKSVLKERETEVDDLRAEVRHLAHCYAAIRPHTLVALVLIHSLRPHTLVA